MESWASNLVTFYLLRTEYGDGYSVHRYLRSTPSKQKAHENVLIHNEPQLWRSKRAISDTASV